MAKGGGGGQSGKVDYPDYIKTIHGQFLDHAGVDTPTSSVTDLVNVALAASPFTSAIAYDPELKITNINNEITSFSSFITSLDMASKWDDFADEVNSYLVNKLDNESVIEGEFDAVSDQLRDQLDTVTLPRFRGGMRDINAVMSSSFAIGEAIIEASNQRDLSKFLADLRLKLKIQRDEVVTKVAVELIQMELNKGELKKALLHYTVDGNRIAIVANKEETDTNLAIDEMDAKWDLDMAMYIGNAIASIAGAATVKEGVSGPSSFRTALGGALSGAASGAMIGAKIGAIGGPAGAGIGALLGLAGGFL
uniref:Uncharacterized protein n=1 Tax=viral metagenome TaxID=1070528 RepID=A0A6M3IMJ7_9ZZZZ